ncbi:MliC family protein [Stappia indica]|uniref:MliC family protein n=1 Tax=Stappia indica TaxID=538381 RepID=UPI001CD7A724|nr:MliC family protein [Stappia indica]MCA1300519.1 MliC family protein [Stappia indica]
MRRPFILAVVFSLPMLIAGAALPAQAEEGPSFDCAKAGSSAEKLVCEDAALASLDRRLTARYAAAVTAVKAYDTGADEALKLLKATQRGWVKGRDECWKADDLRSCVEDAYSRREGELVAGYMLEKPTAVTSWTCGGNPANEIVTSFFDTERPSVRMERGDRTVAGVLTRSASGARYEAPFGVVFWTKGSDALLTWQPDEDLACVAAQ